MQEVCLDYLIIEKHNKQKMLSHNQQDLFVHVCILSIQLISELLMLSPLVSIYFSVFMIVCLFYLIPFLAFSQISIFWGF